MDEAAITPKKPARTRKSTIPQAKSVQGDTQSVSIPQAAPQLLVSQTFDDLVRQIVQSKQEFDNLQKEISQIKKDWKGEQKQHEMEIAQQKIQEDLERKREQETYAYNTALIRKRAEDEFQDKRLAWEKDLSQRKDELENQKHELEDLRKKVSDFDTQKDEAVKEAQNLVEKQLTEKFDNGIRLKEQEIRAEKEVLGLKISNLEAENSRLIKELEVVKRSLDEATRQVKEIAVKVIESGSSQQKAQSS